MKNCFIKSAVQSTKLFTAMCFYIGKTQEILAAINEDVNLCIIRTWLNVCKRRQKKKKKKTLNRTAVNGEVHCRYALVQFFLQFIEIYF